MERIRSYSLVLALLGHVAGSAEFELIGEKTVCYTCGVREGNEFCECPDKTPDRHAFLLGGKNGTVEERPYLAVVASCDVNGASFVEGIRVNSVQEARAAFEKIVHALSFTSA